MGITTSVIDAIGEIVDREMTDRIDAGDGNAEQIVKQLPPCDGSCLFRGCLPSDTYVKVTGQTRRSKASAKGGGKKGK